MTTQTTLDFIERAATAQEKRSPNWQDRAIALLSIYLVSHDTFITEDFRTWATANGLDEPQEPRAYGAVIRRAVKSGMIRATGEYRQTTNIKSHSRPMMVWRKTKQPK